MRSDHTGTIMRKGICSYNRQQGRREGDGPPLEGGGGGGQAAGAWVGRYI